MKRRLTIVLAVGLAALTAGLVLLGGGKATPAGASATTYGTLDNFDVVNDTGRETHGFEIELEGISVSDIVYEFGEPYERYGNPVKIPTATGVIVRYAASYDSASHTWSATTPLVGALDPSLLSHACFTGGMADYWTSGCEHFGLSLNQQPTRTTYRWLFESTTSPGSLVADGGNVPLPAPVWNVTPPATPAAQPVAVAVIDPPAPAPGEQWGVAQWAKVYTTEHPQALDAEEVVDLVQDGAAAPDESEVEIEWVLLQSERGVNREQEFGGNAEVGAGNESVSRRIEFYAYTGAYDSEGEALCDDPTSAAQINAGKCGNVPVGRMLAAARSFVSAAAGDPAVGVGGLIGAQNFAVNVTPGDLNVGGGSPAQCAPGSFSGTGLEPCDPAPAGTYVDASGATLPTACPAGTYNALTGSSSPVDCLAAPAGFYAPGEGNAAPLECPPGTTNDGPGFDFCWALPLTQLTLQPPATSTTQTAAFAWTSPVVTRYLCSLDGAAFAPCSSPRTYRGLAAGLHSLCVEAQADLLPACWVWEIVSPGAPVASITGVAVALSTATVSFTADQPGTGFTCALDAGAYRSCSSPLKLNGLAKGSHTVRVVSTNFAGEPSAVPASATFSVS